MKDIDQKVIFAKNLNRILQERNLTQLEVAKAIDVSAQTFNTWCRGVAIPRMNKIQRLADYFHVNKSDLIDDDPSVPDSLVQINSLFIETYGQNAFDHAMQYNRLDDRDQGKVDGFVASLLEDDKYKGAESSGAKAI